MFCSSCLIVYICSASWSVTAAASTTVHSWYCFWEIYIYSLMPSLQCNYLRWNVRMAPRCASGGIYAWDRREFSRLPAMPIPIGCVYVSHGYSAFLPLWTKAVNPRFPESLPSKHWPDPNLLRFSMMVNSCAFRPHAWTVYSFILFFIKGGIYSLFWVVILRKPYSN